MANFNYFKAVEFGYSDAEIAEHLAKDREGFNLGKARELGYSDKEIIGHLAYGIDPNATTSTKAATRGAANAFTAFDTGMRQLQEGNTLTGKFLDPLFRMKDFVVEDVLGAPKPTAEDKAQLRAKDIRDEFEYELFKDQGYTAEAMAGYAAGTIAHPANWIGGGSGKAAYLAKEGLVIGGVQGLINPTYEEDTDGGRLKSAGIGAGTGLVAGYGIGKFFEKLPKWRGKKTDDLAGTDQTVTTPGKGMADELNTPASPVTKAEEKAAPEFAPTPAKEVEEVIPTPATTVIDPYTATLSEGLEKGAPRWKDRTPVFESDLDKALYIVGNKKQLSAADQRYLDWIKQTTGITDEATLRSLGGRVKAHVTKSMKSGDNVPASRLEELAPKQAAPAFTQPTVTVETPATTGAKFTPDPTPTLGVPTAPYVGQTGSVFANNFNAWEVLDNVSKNLYNIGRKLNEAELLGARPSINAKEYAEATKVLKELNPSATTQDMAAMLKSYSDFLDDLGKAKGESFTPPSMKQVFTDGIDEADWQEMFTNGIFDGCKLI